MPGGVAILFAWGHPSAKIFEDGQFNRLSADAHRKIDAAFNTLDWFLPLLLFCLVVVAIFLKRK